MKKLCLVCAILLSACGGSDHHSVGTAAPPPQVDAFFTAVQNVAATSSEDMEPIAIDSIAATAPDDTEPLAL